MFIQIIEVVLCETLFVMCMCRSNFYLCFLDFIQRSKKKQRRKRNPKFLSPKPVFGLEKVVVNFAYYQHLCVWFCTWIQFQKLCSSFFFVVVLDNFYICAFDFFVSKNNKKLMIKWAKSLLKQCKSQYWCAHIQNPHAHSRRHLKYNPRHRQKML